MNVEKIDELCTVRRRVEILLQTEPSTRESDTELCIKYYSKFHGIMALTRLKEPGVPTWSSITRERRYWQNKRQMYLPLDKVKELREENQVTFGQFYGGMR